MADEATQSSPEIWWVTPTEAGDEFAREVMASSKEEAITKATEEAMNESPGSRRWVEGMPYTHAIPKSQHPAFRASA